jgi:hypothetical protein
MDVYLLSMAQIISVAPARGWWTAWKFWLRSFTQTGWNSTKRFDVPWYNGPLALVKSAEGTDNVKYK